jgi:pimeloyl-ACP methyl ester carboxylesterase
MQGALLLLHGIFGNLNSPRITGAFRNFTVLTPDLIGYGEYRDARPEAISVESQTEHIATWLRQRERNPVHVIGHSIGGALAVLFAERYPELTASISSVEGNFTIEDAFWTAQLATKTIEEIDELVDSYRSDVFGWLVGAGVTPNDWNLSVANEWLNYQPSRTLRAQAAAVVEATKDTSYLETVRDLLDSGTPFHLFAGEKSRHDWHVPDWVVSKATTNKDVPNAGHLMMLDNPKGFAEVIMSSLE